MGLKGSDFFWRQSGQMQFARTVLGGIVCRRAAVELEQMQFARTVLGGIVCRRATVELGQMQFARTLGYVYGTGHTWKL